ncbi:unnamed protein product [Phytomonas sp. EM1]|nr:unnamed protein product [Phytomonas sp. EM1]|eukprot:CCW63503.1 unnamed protein product [Phytomonas sp. isolate EM1]
MASSEDNIFIPGFIIRLQYACYLFVGILVTLVFRSLMSSLFNGISFLQQGCTFIAGNSDVTLRKECVSEMVVYRVSFSLAVFFFFHWLSVSDLTCCIQSSARAELQSRFFYIKSLLLVLIFILTFFIPNSFFAMYAYVCLFCSAFFLLINVVFLVDFSYQWSDDWSERAESNEKWMWYLFGIAVGSFVLAILINIASIYVYVPHADCNLNAFVITVVAAGALVYTVLSIWVPHGSIVPSCLVFLYTSGVLFLTLRTIPSDYCNRYGSAASSGTSLKQMIFGSLVTSFTLAYTVISSSGSGRALNVGLDDQDEEEDPDRSGHLSHYMFFYFIMTLGSMYLAMLATDWRVSGAGQDTFIGSVNIAFWVRTVALWSAMFLYSWSLVAPYTCCKGRDFGFSVDDDWL